MKFRSYISLILSLSFAVFLGHNLVPHHHHTEQLHVPLATDCPIDHEDQHAHEHDGEDPPLHCHAFNDLAFYKYSASQLPEVNQGISLWFVPTAFKLTPSPVRDSSSPHIQIKLPVKLPDCLGALSLRAPPYHA